MDSCAHASTASTSSSTHPVQPGAVQVCEESGTDLAQLVRKKVKVQQKQAATSQASSSAFFM